NLSGTLNNAGTITHGDAVQIYFNSAVLNNLAGAVYELTGDGDFRWNSAVRGRIVNAGTFHKSGGSDTSSLSGGGSAVEFDNTGTVRVSSGTLLLNGPLAQIQGTTLTGGTWIADGGHLNFNANITSNAANLVIAGAGSSMSNLTALATNSGSLEIRDGATFTRTGDFLNEGSLTLGPSGTFTVNGAFTQTADGLLEIQIGGHPASGAFGKLVVTGLASFNGTFEVSLANGYGPNLGTTYQVATFGGRAGTFAHEIGIAPLFTRTIGTGAIVLNA